MIKILIGGSPCTYWSIARTGNKFNKIERETEPEGLGWELFKNYLIAREKFKPDFFLYENNYSISKEIKACISENLGAESMCINSDLVSAQFRRREYWFNWQAEQPEDRNISFQDIKDTDEEYIKRFAVKRTPSRERMWNNGNGRNGGGGHQCANITREIKTKTVTTKQDRSNNAGLVEYKDFCRYLTTHELEQLQTLPIGYTKAITKAQAEKALGNGWTAEVIKHIIAAADIPKNEEIIVLSMYDGIGTGRYVFDSLGYKKIKYYAYEIDKNAIKVAKDNYPDIIEMGDAFKIREKDWRLQNATN